MSTGLLIILPILSKFFHLNDTIILVLCAALDGSGNSDITVNQAKDIDYFFNFQVYFLLHFVKNYGNFIWHMP